jgi:hypothetical protein
MAKEPEVDFIVEISDAKYTFIQYKDGSARALRYGQNWRNVTGDHLICGLAEEVHRLRIEHKQTTNAGITKEQISSVVTAIYDKQRDIGEQLVLENLRKLGIIGE